MKSASYPGVLAAQAAAAELTRHLEHSGVCLSFSEWPEEVKMEHNRLLRAAYVAIREVAVLNTKQPPH